MYVLPFLLVLVAKQNSTIAEAVEVPFALLAQVQESLCHTGDGILLSGFVIVVTSNNGFFLKYLYFRYFAITFI